LQSKPGQLSPSTTILAKAKAKIKTNVLAEFTNGYVHGEKYDALALRIR
jgi:hypothetical protein